MKVYSNYVPEHVKYLTPGKRYEFIPESSGFGTIINDVGDVIHIATYSSDYMCSHLYDRQAWKFDEAE